MKPKPFSSLNHFTVPVAISHPSSICHALLGARGKTQALHVPLLFGRRRLRPPAKTYHHCGMKSGSRGTGLAHPPAVGGRHATKRTCPSAAKLGGHLGQLVRAGFL